MVSKRCSDQEIGTSIIGSWLVGNWSYVGVKKERAKGDVICKTQTGMCLVLWLYTLVKPEQ